MKIIILFICWIVITPVFAQFSPEPGSTSLNRQIALKSFNEPSAPDNNYIRSFVRAQNHRKIFSNIFSSKKAKETNEQIRGFTFYKYVPSLYRINESFLNQRAELKSCDVTMIKISEALGEIFDTFFMEYSIQNRIIR